MNVLTRYRQQQARLRELFEPFTRVNCPTCATPCCTKPTRVRPVDLILIEELTGSVARSSPPAIGTFPRSTTSCWAKPRT